MMFKKTLGGILCALSFGVIGVTQAEATPLGIFVSSGTVAGLPTDSEFYPHVVTEANKLNLGSTTECGNVSNYRPNLGEADGNNDTSAYAASLLWVRNGNATYRATVRSALGLIIGTEHNTCVLPSKDQQLLSVARNIQSYVLAADMIDLKNYDPSFDTNTFRPWLSALRTAALYNTTSYTQTETLTHRCDTDPNNWGTNACAAITAIDRYLGDITGLSHQWDVFRSWVTGNTYGTHPASQWGWDTDQSWACWKYGGGNGHPQGINPAGCQISGHTMDGGLPEELRRLESSGHELEGCTPNVLTGTNPCFRWPIPNENYVYEGLQGIVAMAQFLYRAGYNSGLGDSNVLYFNGAALERAFVWLNSSGLGNFLSSQDDVWTTHLMNWDYDSGFRTDGGGLGVKAFGKNLGFTEWTHNPYQ